MKCKLNQGFEQNLRLIENILQHLYPHTQPPVPCKRVTVTPPVGRLISRGRREVKEGVHTGLTWGSTGLALDGHVVSGCPSARMMLTLLVK